MRNADRRPLLIRPRGYGMFGGGLPMRAKTPNDKYCFECGDLIDRDAPACPRCGASQPDIGVQAAPVADAEDDLTPYEVAMGPRPARPRAANRSKVVAALFALFTGIFGLHKFYLGRPAAGALYLVFCWTFIPAVIGFFEGLELLAMSEDRFAALYD